MKNQFSKIMQLWVLLAGIFILAGCQPAAQTPLPETETPAPPPTQPEPTTLPLQPADMPVDSDSAITFTLSAQTFISPETFQAALGDLDNDGDLDAVFANQQGNFSEVWLNDGQGSFTNTGQQLTQYGHGAGVADFDGDGDLDAVIVCHQFVTPSQIYFNDGSGSLTPSEQDLADASISAAEVFVLDANNDGYPDIHIIYYAPSGLPDKLLINDGSGHFTESNVILNEETIEWGDINGDGAVDYFGKQWGLGYVAYLNDGSGQFNLVWQVDDPQANVGGIALADFDGDHDLDALIANGHRSAGGSPSLLFLNDGTGQFTDSGQRLHEGIGAEFAVGDLDQDNDLDVVISNMDLPNEIWLNDGSGNFSDSGLRLGEKSDMSAKPTLGDLDGDGDLDLIIGSFKIGAQIWFNAQP